MKRKFVIGFILIFLAYLGCKTSVFGFCTSAEKFVERASIPPCHQTADSKEDATNSCECPIIHEELQSSNSSDLLTWKQVKLPVWKGFTVSKPKFHPDPSKKWLVSSFHNSPINFPTKTVRLLI